MHLNTRLQMLIVGYACKIEEIANGDKCNIDTLDEIKRLSRKIQHILLHGVDGDGRENE